MKVSDILNGIERNRGYYPRNAVLAAIQQRDEIIPELLKILVDLTKNFKDLIGDSSYFAHLFSMYLLAQFRVKEAYPLLFEFFSIPGRVSQDLTGDFVTEDLGKVLASVANGDDSLIKKLIENDSVNEYVRSAALRALVVMVAEGEETRENVIDYFSELFKNRLKRESNYVWTSLVYNSTALFPEELLEEIKKAYDDDLIETFSIPLEDIEEEMALGKENFLEELNCPGSRFKFISDTVIATEWWHCFKKKNRTPRIPETTEVKNQIFVGRNDPCPCKSGKKFKKCCGSN